MEKFYIKPDLKSYSACNVVEVLGPCQNQYSATLYTGAGEGIVNLDGTISSNGVIIDTSASQFTVGDDNDNIYYRGFVGFDVASLQGRTIVSATLKIYQAYVDPGAYTDLGTVVADHVNFGTTLDVADFTDNTLTSNIGTISNNATSEWKTMDVTNYVQADLDASRTSSQFRTRFTTNTTGEFAMDRALFRCVEWGEETRPQLVVTYN